MRVVIKRLVLLLGIRLVLLATYEEGAHDESNVGADSYSRAEGYTPT